MTARITALLLALFAASPLMAGEPEVGVIDGIVRMPDGSPWVASEGQFIHLSPGSTTVRPDVEGRFRFERVSSGTYSLVVYCLECDLPEFSGIEVIPGQISTVEIEVDDTIGPPPGPLLLSPCESSAISNSRWDRQRRIYLDALGFYRWKPEEIPTKVPADSLKLPIL